MFVIVLKKRIRKPFLRTLYNSLKKFSIYKIEFFVFQGGEGLRRVALDEKKARPASDSRGDLLDQIRLKTFRKSHLKKIIRAFLFVDILLTICIHADVFN